MSELPIIVTAYVLPGKPDDAAEAHFANSHHAERHGRSLVESGYYCSVLLNDGTESHELQPQPEPEPSGKSFTVEVKRDDRRPGWYVEVTDNLTGDSTPGVRNLSTFPAASDRAENTAGRLRRTGAEVNLIVPEEVIA